MRKVKDFNPWDLIRAIEDRGFQLFVDNLGVVHGKRTKSGVKVTDEMQPLLDQLHEHNDMFATLLKYRDLPIRVELEDVAYEYAKPYLEAVRHGVYQLVGRVTYYRRSQTASFTLEKVVFDNVC